MTAMRVRCWTIFSGLEDCTGRLGTIGICMGGHLAFRAAMNPDVLATRLFLCHRHSQPQPGPWANRMIRCERAGEIKGELLHIWGRQDPHVPLAGRNLIKARLDEVGANFQWLEVNGAHAFMRDEGYRYDPELAALCLNMTLALLHRKLASVTDQELKEIPRKTRRRSIQRSGIWQGRIGAA